MAVRLRYSVAVTVSSNSNEDQDLGKPKFEVVTDLETKGGTWKTVVASGATDLELKLDNISTIQFLTLRTYANDPNSAPNAVSIKRNGTGGEPWPITPVGDAKEGVLVISTDGLTALFMSNAGPSDMAVSVTAVGI